MQRPRRVFSSALYLPPPDAYMAVMNARPILRAGHPILAQTARPVENPRAPEMADLVAVMRASMAAAGGTGLAAPQIGESVRLVIFEVAAARATEAPDDGPVDMTVLFNPTWEVLDDRQELGWEGCLSLPGMRGEVPRYRRIRYHGWGLDGAPIRRIAGGFHARVFQHEVDHLDGVLYPQRMVDMARFGFTEELLAAAATAPEERRDD